MRATIATASTPVDAGLDGLTAAAEYAAAKLGGPPDLSFVFAGLPPGEGVEDAVAEASVRLAPGSVMGCGAQGVVGQGREREDGGVAVWSARLPGARIAPFHLEVSREAAGRLELQGVPDFDEADVVLLLVDPYSFPVEPLLSHLAREQPGLPVVGGLASGPLAGTGSAGLIHEGEAVAGGAVGVALSGVDVTACVSQGARPVGPEMVVTAAEGNVVHELASRPALQRLTEAVADLPALDRALVAEGLLMGVVIDENQPEYERGDFLVRGLLGADEETGSIALGERVRVGQTVRMHVRDSETATEDLDAVLARGRARLEGDPRGALIFTCNGRGSHMFDRPDPDAGTVDRALGGAPSAGLFCAGEIGPVGPRSFVHGFTATLALFG